MALGQAKLQTDGKFFLLDGERIHIHAITYGPFPDPQPDNLQHLANFKSMAAAGLNAIRLYEEPTQSLLDIAHDQGIMVFSGVYWQWDRVFRGVDAEQYFIEGQLRITQFLKRWASHPAIVGIYVANEIRSDIARWIGPEKTKQSIEEMIDLCHALAPDLLAAYANYPSSEYLEPSNADFTGFNIYLEREEDFTRYLTRLHHLAGDRPILISEFGLDSGSHGESKQAEVLSWAKQAALNAGIAGITIFSWSDNWRIGHRVDDQWNFGVTRRDGSAKPALEALTALEYSQPSSFPLPKISVIICTYNGAERVWRAIESLQSINYPDSLYEVIIVDDGSTDETRSTVASYLPTFPQLKLIQAKHGGLSNARNLGAESAVGTLLAYTDDDCEVDRDWLYWTARGYHELKVDALGGPNIPPTPVDEDEAVIAAAPGAPSHIMITDDIAEHIPGCNLTVTKSAFDQIGGFRKTYQIAGDDVDFCWRLEAAGFKIGFHGAAFVWHRRRASLFQYFKQQYNYGKAEALLMRDHPDKFTRGHGASWKGCIYTGGALGAHRGCFIYAGQAASAAYQQVTTNMIPLRNIHRSFQQPNAYRKLNLANYIQPKIRHYARWIHSRKWSKLIRKAVKQESSSPPDLLEKLSETKHYTTDSNARLALIQEYLRHGWSQDHAYSQWDLIRNSQKLLVSQEMVGTDLWCIRERRSEHSS